MKVHQWISVWAGLMVLLSAALAAFVSPWWLLFTCFVGVNLIQYAFTGFCPAGIVLKRCGVPECGAAPAQPPTPAR